MHPIDHLAQEHRRIGRISRLVDAELERYAAGAPLNVTFLKRVAEFFLWPVAQSHEAKELVLYEAMRAHRLPVPSAVLDRVIGEHASGRVQLEDWERAAYSEIRTKEEKQTLAELVRHALRLHGEHTRDEEQVVYPLARRLLPRDELDALRSAFAEIEATHESIEEAAALIERTFGESVAARPQQTPPSRAAR